MRIKTKSESLRKKLAHHLIEVDISDTDIVIIKGKADKSAAGLSKVNISEKKTIDQHGKEYITESVINRMIFRMVKGLYPTEKELYLMRVAYFQATHQWIKKRPGIETTYPRLIRMLAFWEFISTHSLNEKEAKDLFLSLRYGFPSNYDHARLRGYSRLVTKWEDNLWIHL